MSLAYIAQLMLYLQNLQTFFSPNRGRMSGKEVPFALVLILSLRWSPKLLIDLPLYVLCFPLDRDVARFSDGTKRRQHSASVSL